MADYFDRLLARVLGAAATVTPPHRTIFDPAPAAATGLHTAEVAGEVLVDAPGMGQIPGRPPPRDLATWSVPEPSPRPPSAVEPTPPDSTTDLRPPQSDSPTQTRRRPPQQPEPVAPTPRTRRQTHVPLTERATAEAPTSGGPPAPAAAATDLLRDEPRPAAADQTPSARHLTPRTLPGPAPVRSTPSRTEPATAPTPVPQLAQTIVQVSIGRIEVKAAPTPSAPVAPAHPPAETPRPRLTLDAFLDRASERRRR